MHFVLVVITLSFFWPCDMATIPHGCSDYVVKLGRFDTMQECSRRLPWWNQHIKEAEAESEDTGAAICIPEPKDRGY